MLYKIIDDEGNGAGMISMSVLLPFLLCMNGLEASYTVKMLRIRSNIFIHEEAHYEIKGHRLNSTGH